MNSKWNSPGTVPADPDEYQAALEPSDAATTARRYFNGKHWSNPYHSNWPDDLKVKCRSEFCEFLPYWKPVVTTH